MLIQMLALKKFKLVFVEIHYMAGDLGKPWDPDLRTLSNRIFCCRLYDIKITFISYDNQRTRLIVHISMAGQSLVCSTPQTTCISHVVLLHQFLEDFLLVTRQRVTDEHFRRISRSFLKSQAILESSLNQNCEITSLRRFKHFIRRTWVEHRFISKRVTKNRFAKWIHLTFQKLVYENWKLRMQKNWQDLSLVCLNLDFSNW